MDLTDSVLSDSKEIGGFFDSDEAAGGVETSDAGGTGTHAGIQYGIPGVGVGLDEIAQQGGRLLGWMETALSVRGKSEEVDAIAGVAVAV